MPIAQSRKPKSPLIYLLFFLSGISGLIYQVVWVRVFGNVFGNTIYSASIVVAVFMLGLGVGSYVVGAWADRRYARLRLFELRRDSPEPRSNADAPPHSLLRVYGTFEIVIAAMGLAIAAVLCVLDRHVDPGQIAKVKGTLPRQLRQMWEEAEGIAFPERGPLVLEQKMQLESA